jgi:hypothetical protein
MSAEQQLHVEDEQVAMRFGDLHETRVERRLDSLERALVDQIRKAEPALRAHAKGICDHHLVGMAIAKTFERGDEGLALLGRTGAVKRVAHHRVGVEQARDMGDVGCGRRRTRGHEVGEQAVVGAARRIERLQRRHQRLHVNITKQEEFHAPPWSASRLASRSRS